MCGLWVTAGERLPSCQEGGLLLEQVRTWGWGEARAAAPLKLHFNLKATVGLDAL